MPKHLTAEELKKFEQQKKNLREIRKKIPLQNPNHTPADFMTPENVRIETMDHYLKWMEATKNDEFTKKEAEEYISKKIDEFPDYADTPILNSENRPLHPLHFGVFLSSEILRDKLVEKAKTLPPFSVDEFTKNAQLKTIWKKVEKSLQEKPEKLLESSKKILDLLQKNDPADAPQRKESIQELIKKGFNRDLAYHEGNLAAIAAKEGFYDLIEPLRNSEQIYRNDSALHIAAQFGSQDLLRQLLDSGYDINSVNKEGKTAVDMAGEDSGNGKFLISKGAKNFNARSHDYLIYASKLYKEITSVDETRITIGNKVYSIQEIEKQRRDKIRDKIINLANGTNQIAESLATTGTFFDEHETDSALAAKKIRELLSKRESEKDSNPNDAKNLHKKVSDGVVIDLKTQALAEAANIYRDEVITNKLARAFEKLHKEEIETKDEKKMTGINPERIIRINSERITESNAKLIWTNLLTKVDRKILHDLYQSQNPSTDFVKSDDVFDSSKLKADPDLWQNDSEFLTKMMKWCVKEADLRKEITAEIIKESDKRNEDLYGKNGEEGKIDQAVKAFKEPGKSPSNPGGEPILSALRTRLLQSQ